MPGIVVPSGTHRHPSASQQTAIASSSSRPKTSGSERRQIFTTRWKPYRLDSDSDSHQGQIVSRSNLAKPLAKDARRAIKKETKKLIKTRNLLDEAILGLAKKTSLGEDDGSPRQDKLLRRLKRLEREEICHLKKLTAKLAELEKFYTWDPSADRASDYDLVRKLLWRFKRNLGPLFNEYQNRLEEDVFDDSDDETSCYSSDSEPMFQLEESDVFGDKDQGLRQEPHHEPETPVKLHLHSIPEVDSQKSKSPNDSAGGAPLSNLTLGQEMNYEGSNPFEDPVDCNSNRALSSSDLTKKDETTTVTSLPGKGEQRKRKHRLDYIVRQGLSAIDDCVYDIPNGHLGPRKNGPRRVGPRIDGPRVNELRMNEPRKKRYIDSGDTDCHMSGALLTDPSPSQAERKYVVKPVEGAKKNPGDPQASLITPNTSSHGSTKLSDLPSPAFLRKLRIWSGSINESPSAKSGPSKIGPDNHQVQVTPNPDQPTLSRSHSIPALSSSVWNSSDGMTSKGQWTSDYGLRTVIREDPPYISSRRETPVPAPQPWRKLGIENPFDDPFSTPLKRSWSRLKALSGDNSPEEQDTPNSSKPQLDELPGPDSSPLNKVRHKFFDSLKKYEHKSKKHRIH
ncbi:hypothetical protein F5Y14DRAFT_458502 [Nemania sp. NC0429]|nr:hypothetical protein F5Y14DRAFT_458502 [Nemania sp. NC0429]